MRSRIVFVLTASAVMVAVARPAAAQAACQGHNALSAADKAAGWVLLFDGASMNGWHGYNGQKTPAWSVADCALHSACTEGNYGSDLRADLATDAEYTNFELSIDWNPRGRDPPAGCSARRSANPRRSSRPR